MLIILQYLTARVLEKLFFMVAKRIKYENKNINIPIF